DKLQALHPSLFNLAKRGLQKMECVRGVHVEKKTRGTDIQTWSQGLHTGQHLIPPKKHLSD
ncbi:hypothetical protein ACTXT7_017205, partial [Hymenolepis weldensis]